VPVVVLNPRLGAWVLLVASLIVNQGLLLPGSIIVAVPLKPRVRWCVDPDNTSRVQPHRGRPSQNEKPRRVKSHRNNLVYREVKKSETGPSLPRIVLSCFPWRGEVPGPSRQFQSVIKNRDTGLRSKRFFVAAAFSRRRPRRDAGATCGMVHGMSPQYGDMVYFCIALGTYHLTKL
jgi:hypothetical protein